MHQFAHVIYLLQVAVQDLSVEEELLISDLLLHQ